MKLDLSVHQIDVPESIKQGSAPTLIFPSDGGLNWYVIDKPINPSGINDVRNVSHACHGEYVNVALFPYLTPCDPIASMAFVSQLSFVVGGLFPNAAKLTLAVGYPLDIVESPELASVAYRLWIGFAVCVNEK